MMSELPAATQLIEFPRPLESIYILSNWIYWGCEGDFEYRKGNSGGSVFFAWQNVAVHTLPGN